MDFLDPSRDGDALLACRHLALESQDAPNSLWVAGAHETASLQRLASANGGGGGVGGGAAAAAGGLKAHEVLEWARGAAGQQQLALYQQRIGRLMQGG